MNVAGSIPLQEALSENQRRALLTLLVDDDPAVYRAVRETILSHGSSAAEWLRPQTRCGEAVLRRRALEIVLYFDRQAADDQFLAFCLNNGDDLDLEAGAWLLARTRYPDINVDGYRALMDNFADELRERLVSVRSGRPTLEIINQYLFNELGFVGNEKNYYDPENSYLNRVLDRRTGNPITLCLFYLLLARRLQLPVAGIGLPGHFICRYQSSAEESYVDVFNGGKLLTKADCVQYLLQGNYSLQEDYLAPSRPRRTLLRICSNLHQIHVQADQEEDGIRFQRYLVALSK